ncbi:response regulator [bacterium]|nr:response regulator [bacterium]
MKVLRQLFPFSLVVNRQLKVLTWGDSLCKVTPEVCRRGTDLSQLVRLERPHSTEVTRDFLLSCRRQGQIWRLNTSQLNLRGQVVVLPKERIFLAFTPVLSSLQQLEQLGLDLGDLGVLDNSIEFLMQAQLQEVAMADSTRLRQVLQSKNAELTRQRLELETAQEIAQLGSFEGPADGPYVFSRNLYRLLGLSAQSQIDLSDLLALYAPLTDQFNLASLLQGGTFDVQLGEVWHRWTVYRANDRISGTVQDISLQKHSENQLLQAKLTAERANQAKSDFLAMMSHEIRTPMNGVLGLTELLLNSVTEPELRDMLDLIRQSGQSLLVILNDILDYSRIESGQMPVELREVQLQPLLSNLMQLLSPQAERQGVGLELRMDRDLPAWVRTDPTRLQQVISNLVGNAIKFTHQGKVVCRVSHRDSLLQISVQDTGIGIAPEHLARLFQPFVQAEASTTRRYGGTGLGLSICQRLCRMLGGDIAVESVPGQGSCFRFWVAAPPAQAPGPSLCKPVADLNFAADLRILVAEDNLVNRRVLMGMLGRLGLSATVVENGRLGLCECQKQGFDLMILDVEMPEMDGLELIRRVRAGEGGVPNRDAYIVSLTAQARERDQEGCLEAGANGFLSKPVSLSQLQQALRPLARG